MNSGIKQYDKWTGNDIGKYGIKHIEPQISEAGANPVQKRDERKICIHRNIQHDGMTREGEAEC